MNCITIKEYHTEGLLAVETYDTDTCAVGGFTVKTSDLGRWLGQYQPCQVHLHVNDDALRRLVHDAGRSIPDVYVGRENWRANVR